MSESELGGAEGEMLVAGEGLEVETETAEDLGDRADVGGLDVGEGLGDGATQLG